MNLGAAPPILSLALPLLLLRAPAQAQTLVENIHQGPSLLAPDSSPSGFQAFGGQTLFAAGTEATGREAWVTDGSAAGTQLLADIYAGPGWSNPTRAVQVASGQWLFAAESAAFGLELWSSDGTVGSAEPVVDLWPGTDSAEVGPPTEHNGEAYFFARTPGLVRALWRSNGQFDGTNLVADLSVGGLQTVSIGLEQLLSTPLGLFFSTTDGVEWRLWLTQGGFTGATLLAEVEASAAGAPTELTWFNGRVFFSAEDPVRGTELWSSNGTPGGTRIWADIAPGVESSTPRSLTLWNGSLYFAASEPLTGRELWRTDGVPGDTVRVTDLATGPLDADPDWLTPHGSELVFRASVPLTGTELYTTDGTPGNAALFADLLPGGQSGGPSNVVSLGSEILCSAFRPEVGVELFASDGTPAGTRLVRDIQPGIGSSFPTEPFVAGSEIYFAASEGSTGEELWRSDGTEAGTQLLADIAAPQVDLGSFPRRHVSLGSRTLFEATSAEHGTEWWTTDGHTVELLADLYPGPMSGAGGGEPFAWNGLAYLPTRTPEFGEELWVTDGTAEGTQLVTDLFPGALGSAPRLLGALGHEVLFTALDATVGREVFATDGTPGNVRLVADVDPGGGSSFAENYALIDGRGYFSATVDGFGREPFVTDGTSAGTVRLADTFPGVASGFGTETFIGFDGAAWFAAESPGVGQELWRSDGTPGGTALFTDINAFDDSFPEAFVAVDENLYLMAVTTGIQRQMLTVRAGTGEITQLTSFVTLGATGLEGIADDPFRVGDGVGVLYDDVFTGQNLFVTDGTETGSFTIATIDPTGQYVLWSDQGPFTATGGVAFFGANDGLFGQELWSTDGTFEGTQRLTDIQPAGADSRPAWLARVGNRLVFAADDGQLGTELHSLPLDLAGTWIAEPYGSGCPGTTGTPTLTAGGEVRIGAAFTLDVAAAAPSATTFLFVDTSSARTDLGGDCTLLLANPLLTATLPTDATGSLTLPVQLPDSPALIGLEVWIQSATTDAGAALGLSLTPALELVIGA